MLVKRNVSFVVAGVLCFFTSILFMYTYHGSRGESFLGRGINGERRWKDEQTWEVRNRTLGICTLSNLDLFIKVSRCNPDAQVSR
jgi:hypothetical protein